MSFLWWFLQLCLWQIMWIIQSFTVRDIESKSTTSAGGPGDFASPANFIPDQAGLTQLALILQLPPHLREIKPPKAVCFPRFFPRTKWEGRLPMWGEMETFITLHLLTQHRSLLSKDDREAAGNYLPSLIPPLKGSAWAASKELLRGWGRKEKGFDWKGTSARSPVWF